MPKENLYTPNCIRTFTGRYLDVFNPRPEDIDITDIAHGLAHQCRFGGHTKRFHTVAEHCIVISSMVPEWDAMAALLHDAAEAYLGDIPKPIKARLPDYQVLEDNLMEAIAAKFGFAFPLPQSVKFWDKKQLEYEWKNKVLEDNIVSMYPLHARQHFILRYEQISKTA